MPNGFQGSQADWDRLEGPLRRLDPELEAFASRHAMELTQNLHGWPERSLTWVDGVERTIQLLLQDESALTFNVWIAAWEERRDGRYWKRAVVANGLAAADLAARLSELLEAGRNVLASWAVDDLVRAGR